MCGKGDQMLEIMRKRSQSEEAALSPVRNRLPGEALFALLDARKEVKTQQELDQLCRTFNIDLSELEQLRKHVNTPTVEQIPSNLDEEGELFLVGLVGRFWFRADLATGKMAGATCCFTMIATFLLVMSRTTYSTSYCSYRQAT
jgi:hypothetical protein